MHERRFANESDVGAALIVVILLLLALTALGHGAFLIALQEASASRASAALAQARLMAEGGVRRALRARSADTLPETNGGSVVLAEGTAPDALFHVELRRMTRELYWVEGRGRASLAAGGPQRVLHEVGWIVWALSPLERLRAQSAAIEAGAGLEDPAGAVASWRARETGGQDAPVGCLDRSAQIDSAVSGRFFDPSRSVSLPPGRIPPLGLLNEDSLLARVQERVSGTVSPRPVAELGECVPGLLNWGSPTDPASPCAGRRVAIASEEPLTLDGGEGQGLLLVRGDLRLTGGARFHGLVLVAGDLSMEGGAVIHGLARVAGRARLVNGAAFEGQFCPALLALEATPELRRTVHLPGGWIRPF